MGKLNKVQLIGNLGDDVKLHFFDGGGCLGRVSLATQESYTKKDTGEKVQTTDWHNVVFRNKVAEIVEKYAKKGSLIYVEGKLKTRSYEKDGEKKYVTEIVVTDFEFLSKSKATEEQQNNSTDSDPDDLPY